MYYLFARVSALLWLLLDWLGLYNPPKIPGILSIPGYPIVGNLLQVLSNPAEVYMKWSDKHEASLFQVQLGAQRMVVVNKYQDVYNLWVKHSFATASRPVLYTFHDIVSATQGFTVGSTPFCPSYVLKKKTLASNLNKKAVSELSGVFDKEVNYTIRNLILDNRELLGPPSCNIYRNFRNESCDIDLYRYFQLFALRSSVYITYGLHLDCYRRDGPFCQDIIDIEAQIMRYRSTTSNLADYIIPLRYLPGVSKYPEYIRGRRDFYMEDLMDSMKRRYAREEHPIKTNLVAKIASKNCLLTDLELKSICLTMVSAGLDNTPLTMNYLMGQLSHPHGEKQQERAFNELMRISGNRLISAWEAAATEQNCDYITALVYEALRSFSVLPLGLPRVTTKDITYKDVTIPAGTTLVMNAYAANHDENVFENPYQFNPNRWLDTNGNLLHNLNKFHLTFGLGTRMCSGNHLAMAEMYTLTCRMILMFKIKAPTGPLLMVLDPFRNNRNSGGTSFEPKPFKVRLEPRVWSGSDTLYYRLMRQ
ncbi:cytochrome P450 [Suhomyces tanzawaensis NRRL Y-17324]|uniref:Cytochrome P450 n=1 Tax=Suhomyces tanzawaensis NRRL Y-17324 TaxID=984487 RepID=A0A1E4SBJ1_9ASCO|nr:cytochrome P450 [Suhomyces tanzawaensis NRRL Y-17324]ODV76884.1 cytochrome P450 [Suhomyces tanzawaensis NRRL Y-17324]